MDDESESKPRKTKLPTVDEYQWQWKVSDPGSHLTWQQIYHMPQPQLETTERTSFVAIINCRLLPPPCGWFASYGSRIFVARHGPTTMRNEQILQPETPPGVQHRIYQRQPTFNSPCGLPGHPHNHICFSSFGWMCIHGSMA